MQFSKGQQKIIDKAKNETINPYTKEQIDCLSVPMLIKQCQSYSGYKFAAKTHMLACGMKAASL